MLEPSLFCDNGAVQQDRFVDRVSRDIRPIDGCQHALWPKLASVRAQVAEAILKHGCVTWRSSH
ncbi:hypothetical protein ASPWEDRAFT_42222 [Aspergillus wentii DTO 134E9]|uniref:Uncharacterized protein n=1 Tax=Aspergillus wentii DTO 134E9 TaxID=1073089 RepID=A0A1L9RHG3_ASPWE|nr:uncharacterized protein ASPWEDRAFT_42222 [Aspergillus wentii DTO 134E9]OJJ34273.1 hypothetical protein ASPWEDRAFT_42222 [Aspergillus wentii DTO 134E9]